MVRLCIALHYYCTGVTVLRCYYTVGVRDVVTTTCGRVTCRVGELPANFIWSSWGRHPASENLLQKSESSVLRLFLRHYV